jgi:hypothetical protein
MRAQNLREEVTKKEREKHFNTIRSVIPIKQEWRVKEKASTPALMDSDDDMDLLDDDESPFIKDGSLPPPGMVIIMEGAQMCLGPKEVMFEKPEESSQHMKPLYIRGYIDRRSISRMLINGGAAINLMPYSIFKKLEREDDELVKTNLTHKGVGPI